MGACRALQQPRVGLYDAKKRAEWEAIYDRANAVRHDLAVERAVEQLMRRPGTGRRTDPRSLFGKTVTLAAQFRGTFLANGGGGNQDVWLDYSFVAIDGVSGKLQSLVDYIDNTHLVTQANTTIQPTAPATDASFAGAVSSFYSGSNYADSNRAPPFWGRWQDGAGCTQTAVYVPTTLASATIYALHTTGNSATLNGMAFGIVGQPGNATGSGFAQVFKTAASNSIIVNSSTLSDATNTATYRSFKFASASSPNWLHSRRGSTLASGAQAFAPGAGDAQASLRIGANVVAAANHFAGRMRAHYFWRRYLNSAEETTRNAWIQKDAGVLP